MKGMFIHKQIEYRLEVAGDEFIPGTELACTLTVKNRAAEPRVLSGLYLRLAHGDIKKMASKAAGAVEVMADAGIAEPGDVGANEHKSFSCTFPLDRNVPVTDKAHSLFLLYGIEGEEGAAGELRVLVEVHPHMKTVMEILESNYQFVFKGVRSSHGWVQGKFKPPTARRLSLVNELTLCSRFDGDALELKYLFNVKKFDSSESQLSVKKGKDEVLQRFEPGEYLLLGGYFNHDHVTSKVEEALSTVATGL